ncbi:CoA-binding protein [Bacteriovoracaceae bacterium]|nr:CoA-binding protein [Bacteriovoracaceae bacterium]
MKTTIILGASNKAERYSYLALNKLEEHGHPIYLVHPSLSEIREHKVYPELNKIPLNSDVKIDTITLYLSPKHLEPLIVEIIKIKPKRVIFNPGTELPQSYEQLKKSGIEVLEACTLVLLNTNQY